MSSQTSTNLSSSGSGNEACPEKCTIERNPTFDKNNVLYLNECMLRLAECSGNPHLSASYFVQDILLVSDLNGTVYLSPPSGSGSQEQVVVDYGFDKLFGGGESSLKSILDGSDGAGGPAEMKPSTMKSLADLTKDGDA